MATMTVCRRLQRCMVTKTVCSTSWRSFSQVSGLNEVVIASAVRTPVGSFMGGLAPLKAGRLGAVTLQAAIDRAGVPVDAVTEVYMGNVLQAGQGQSPARQAVIYAGLPDRIEATTINKVCASGIKSVMLAAQSLMCGHQEVMLAGGMESMSNSPFYLKRGPTPYGGIHMQDSILIDGITDIYSGHHMGDCAEVTAAAHSVSRDEQDTYAVRSYTRSQQAASSGVFSAEIVPVTVPLKKGKEVIISEDEEYKKVDFEKLKKLRTVFKPEGGTVTAGNASTLNDASSTLCVMTAQAANRFNVKPLAKIITFADAATAPADYCVAPALAIPKVLQQAGMTAGDVDRWEINEAFSIVVIVCSRILDLDPDKVNVHGGAVSIGHPIGMSGARLITHLVHTLSPGQRGVAAICNGGGAASAIMVERL